MSSAPRYTPHYTVGDYRQWQGDWELWNGVAVARTPSPFGRHGSMLARLVTTLTNAVDASGCRASVLAEIDWIIAEDTVVRPDATVVCGAPPEGHIESTPAIVVEVLSAATRERDLEHKRALYQDQCVPWYLIADPDNGSLSLLGLREEHTYVPVAIEDDIELAICEHCRLSIDLRRCLPAQ